MTKERKYFYIINHPKGEKELCDLEIKSLFNIKLEGKKFFSEIYVNPTRSPYIKEALSIIYEEDSLEEIVNNIKRDNLSYDDFKVWYIKQEEGNVPYDERLNALREIGLVINGEPNIHEPKVNIGVTVINNKWFLGIYEKNDCKWHIHDKKPRSYSNSIGIRTARALVNIAIGNNLDTKLVDPCCGVGTVVLEALSMGVDVKGYEIRWQIARDAKENLRFFGYDEVIQCGDMHKIEEKYDVAIIDLPYGLFTPVTLEEQTNIINSARKIADKLVLVTFEDMDKYIEDAGFKIIDRARVCKGKFIRYINVCC